MVAVLAEVNKGVCLHLAVKGSYEYKASFDRTQAVRTN